MVSQLTAWVHYVVLISVSTKTKRAIIVPLLLFLSCFIKRDTVAEQLERSSLMLKVFWVQNTACEWDFSTLSLSLFSPSKWVPGSRELGKMKSARKRSVSHLSYTVARNKLAL